MSNVTDSSTNYSNSTSIKNFWVNKIAPKYWDMVDVNLYKAGMFGYVNEVMATVTEDGMTNLSLSRSENYPVTATYDESLYKMAILQTLDLPMAIPATANIILLISTKDIINNGTSVGSQIKFVVDDTLVAYADTVEFMLNYPIIILANIKGDSYNYTTHYDFTKANSMAVSNDKYIKNKIINKNGEQYLLLSLEMRQVLRTQISELVFRSSTLNTIFLDFIFDGDLAGFDVFYQANDNSPKIQLKKQLQGSQSLKIPFCNYTLIDKQTIRIIFPYNLYFNPAYNSIISLDVYTSKGRSGNFDSFNGDILCDTSQSEDFSYNKDVIILGKLNGSSIGGYDKLTSDEFKRKVIEAYSTNKTITTASDLQILYNDKSDNYNKLVFNKRRDDAFERLYGAYMIMRDSSYNIIPTNTLNILLTDLEFDESYEGSTTKILKPGKILRYKDASKSEVYIDHDMDIMSDLDSYETSDFLYTNPLLISVTLETSTIGYYLNSCDYIKPVEFLSVNDNSHMQFIANNLHVSRNALLGENYYKITFTMAPSTDLDFETVVYVEEDEYIRAAKNGKVKSITYIDKCPVMTLLYSDNTEETINIGSYVDKVDGNYVYTTGYTTTLIYGSKFMANNIIATKKPNDLGKIRMIGIFKDASLHQSVYLPFVIDSYDADNNFYTYAAYLATNDYIVSSTELIITDGFVDINGDSILETTMNMYDLTLDVNIFYYDDTKNYSHIYSGYNYISAYTLTNVYSQTKDNVFNLMTPIQYIRSKVIFLESVGEVISINLKESPIIKSNWIRNQSNFIYFMEKLLFNYNFIQKVFTNLEGNFGVDLKFFNTYGKSRYFNVGIKDTMAELDKVNCTFSFGIKLDSLSNQETFREKFTAYVQAYVEDLNDSTSIINSIYILNMTTDIKNNFAEIEYLEYYGMNNYDYSVQKIEAVDTTTLLTGGSLSSYIPEFINIFAIQVGETSTRKIDITFIKKQSSNNNS